MVSDRDRTSWGARLLAPLAFFAAATALVLVVHNSLNAGTNGEAGNDTEQPAPADDGAAPGGDEANGDDGPGAQNGQQQEQPQRRRYRIRSGDTLEGIAARFDTTVDELLSLNPGIDPNSLTPGQRIRVR